MPVRAVYVTADVVQKSFDARPGVGGSLRIRADAGHPEQRPQQARADSGVIEEGMPGCRVLLDVVLDPEAGKAVRTAALMDTLWRLRPSPRPLHSRQAVERAFDLLEYGWSMLSGT